MIKRRVNRIVRFAIALCMMASYLVPLTPLSWISPFTHVSQFKVGYFDWATTMCLCLFVSSSWFVAIIRAQNRSNLILWVAGIYLLSLVATAVTWHQENQISSDCLFVASAMASGLLAAVVCSEPSDAAFLLVALGTIQGCYALYYHHNGQDIFVSGDVSRAGGTFGLPAGVYTLMLFAIPFSLTRVLSSIHTAKKTVYMICTAIMVAAFTITWYRGGVVGLGAALVWLTYRISRKPSMAFVVVAGMCFWFFATDHVRTLGATNFASASRSDEGRTYLWREGEQIFVDHWQYGVGIGALEIPVIIGSKGHVANEIDIEPKNQVLFWLDEIGIGGCVLIILAFIAAVRGVHADKSYLAAGVGASWVAFLVAGFFDTLVGTSDRYCGNAVFGLLLGMTLRLGKRLPSAPEAGTPIHLATDLPIV